MTCSSISLRAPSALAPRGRASRRSTGGLRRTDGLEELEEVPKARQLRHDDEVPVVFGDPEAVDALHHLVGQALVDGDLVGDLPCRGADLHAEPALFPEG